MLCKLFFNVAVEMAINFPQMATTIYNGKFENPDNLDGMVYRSFMEYSLSEFKNSSFEGGWCLKEGCVYVTDFVHHVDYGSKRNELSITQLTHSIVIPLFFFYSEE